MQYRVHYREKIKEVFIVLLRFIFTGAEVPEEYKNLAEDEASALYDLAKKHDLTHIIDLAFDKCKMEISEPVKKAFHKQKMTAFYRSSLRDEEYKKVTELFEQEKIKYIPLKGSVIKNLYPEAWMRTSCDIDILVTEEDLDKANNLLREKLSYKVGEKGTHDVSSESPLGVQVEIHYKLTNRECEASKLLDNVWDSAKKCDDGDYCYEMDRELFYYYHVWHMSKHFKYGGCGIKNFIDLWLLNKKYSYDIEKRKNYVKEGSRDKFEITALKLGEAWMEGAEKDEVTSGMEKFILEGGSYGSAEQHISARKTSKLGYIFGRLFLKRKTLAFFYPGLNKSPLLYPYYTVKRWCKIFNKNDGKVMVKELQVTLATSDKRKKEIAKLFDDLEIG